MLKNIFLISTVIYLIQIISIYGQYLGQSCIVERTQSPGSCKAINDCPSVIDDILNGRQHTRCSFKDKIEIICCPTPTKAPVTRPPLSINSRISEQKCENYKDAMYEYIYSLSLASGAQRKKVRVDKCGHKAIPLVVGGEDAKAREFPHMALIGFQTNPDNPNLIEWPCNGALVSDEYILTAAHCCYTKDWGEPKYVRLGELNILSENDDARPEDFNISQIIVHPEYKRPSKYNDIALLKLDRKVEINPYKRPACLPTEFENPEKRSIASGWGHTEFAGKASPHLQKVILEKFTQEECNQTFSSVISRRLANGIRSTQLCAGSKTEIKDTCQGDSGGPLQIYNQQYYCMYTIIGVTSFGMQCGTIGVPGVYTRVYSYLDWIEPIVWPN